ncbi:kinase-regulated stress-responsive transcription factor skn7 [Tulasnella sp. 427]|nr:kinase-regulated stress-responsive transcription factor skn7 [Tulasnella sp. 427]
MASNHHAQPLPPSGHIHHQYASHPQPPPQRPAYSSHPSSSHPPANRHLPPLASQSQSPPYPHRQDSSLPSLSPYNQRPPYPPSTSFPPPLSRQQSQHQAPPPQSYHHQQPPQPGHYPPPPPSSHGHGHWDSPQNGRHDPPPPPQHPAHPSHPGHQRSDSSSSKLNGVPPTRRPSVSERESTGAPEPPPIAAVPREAEESGPPASDFVKKLAKMLDDPNYASVVSWGPKGDCFVDMTEFTKSILPRMFKHSNFASFVRQLNKYDFHKIKNSDEYGDQCWTFHHPDFQRSNRDALENIKRKVPAQRKTGRGSTAAGPPLPGSPSDAPAGGLASVETGAVSSMQAQIDALSRSNDDLVASIAALERNYQNVLNEMVVYQRGMAAQDSLMQNLISYFIQLENGKSPNDGLGKVIETYGGERPSFPHLNGMAGMSYSGSAASVDSNATTLVSGSSPDLSPMERSVLARQDLEITTMDNTELLESPGGSRLRLRKGAFSPAWAVPPRVLLVDDDQVSRKLFSKFLQVSGCTIDVAVDGIGAVNKMNLEKYDLVLMDIVMPKLDGVSATSLIRQFDHMTPIISMTSNNKPNDVVTYYSSGMNDILPKPFTRESLFTMLEKHLMHLKAITMARPPMEDPGRMIAPTDEQYSSMLNLLGMGGDPMSGFPSMDPGAGLTMAEPAASVKRALEVDDDRDTKRPRFELVE